MQMKVWEIDILTKEVVIFPQRLCCMDQIFDVLFLAQKILY